MYHQKNQLKCAICPDLVQLVEDFQTGNLVCPRCGLAIEDRGINVGADCRSFSNDTQLNKSRVSRVREESVLYDIEISPIIDPTGSSTLSTESGEGEDHNKKRPNLSQKSLVTECKEMVEMAQKLNITRSVMESGQLIFEKVHFKREGKYRSKESIAAACLYIACRKNNVPRTFNEICAVTKSSKKGIGKCFKFISNMIGEVLVQTSVVQYIPRFCARLELPTAVENRARHLVERFEALGILAGRSPTTVAALAIMMAIDGLKWYPKDQTAHKFASAYVVKQIVQVTGASSLTIREAHQVVKAQGGKEFAEYFPKDQCFRRFREPQPNGSKKYLCKSPGCGQSFLIDIDLALHQRIHLGIMPFSCPWPKCSYLAMQKSCVVEHVNTQHFKLPKLKTDQARLNIVDNLNSEDYVRVDHKLLQRRLE